MIELYIFILINCDTELKYVRRYFKNNNKNLRLFGVYFSTLFFPWWKILNQLLWRFWSLVLQGKKRFKMSGISVRDKSLNLDWAVINHNLSFDMSDRSGMIDDMFYAIGSRVCIRLWNSFSSKVNPRRRVSEYYSKNIPPEALHWQS